MNAKNNELLIDNLPKLKWACRRGMLELDVILSKFLNEQYSKLSRENKLKFVNLLDEADPELFNWLLGHEKPREEHAAIVALIRGNRDEKI